MAQRAVSEKRNTSRVDRETGVERARSAKCNAGHIICILCFLYCELYISHYRSITVKLEMDPIHAVMVVLLIVLIAVSVKGYMVSAACAKKVDTASGAAASGGAAPAAEPAAAPTTPESSTTDATSVSSAGSNPANAAVAEAMHNNVEYFDSCGGVDEVTKTLDCSCDPNSSFPFSKNAYGAPGMDYNAYAMSQGVDNQVIRNHGEFTKERTAGANLGNNVVGSTGQSQLGRPKGDADGLGYVSKNWIGIRGSPFKSCINDPTQLQGDEDYDAFRTKRYCF
jgi:hypothetical protein